MTKRCKLCKKSKNTQEFCIDRYAPDGLQGWCRRCHREYRTKRRGAQPTRLVDRRPVMERVIMAADGTHWRLPVVSIHGTYEVLLDLDVPQKLEDGRWSVSVCRRGNARFAQLARREKTGKLRTEYLNRWLVGARTDQRVSYPTNGHILDYRRGSMRITERGDKGASDSPCPPPAA